MRIILLFLIAMLPAFPQAFSQWFVTDMGSFHNSEQGCFKPANTAYTSSGLTITAQAQVIPCGDSQTALTTFNYTSGTLISNTFSFTYGIMQFQITTPSGQGTGLWPTFWLEGVNCWGWKLGFAVGSGGPSCNWPMPGSEEIDAFEQHGTTNIDFALHSSGGSPVHTMAGAAGTTYTVTMVWSAGSISFYLGSTLEYTITAAYVPSTPMFMLINFAIGGSSGSPVGVSFPQTWNIRYVRVMPLGTCTPGACTQANASCGAINGCFDDEFPANPGPLPSVYVGQSFSGNYTGLDCADSYGVLNNTQVSWINDAGYWSNGQIGPGTTINLCPVGGSVSTTLVMQGSGTSGSPITVNSCGVGSTINLNGQTNINQSACGAGSSGATASSGNAAHN